MGYMIDHRKHMAIHYATGFTLDENLLNEIICSWFFEQDKPRKKPKSNLKGIPERDQFQTPPYAVDMILPYIPEKAVIWEWAAGEGNITNVLYNAGHTVLESDLLTGLDFFKDKHFSHTVKVTNLPFSVKYPAFKLSYELGQPFIYLAPTDALHSKTLQRLAAQYGLYVIMPDGRINFKTPKKGWENSNAQFHCSWFLGNFDWIKPGIEISNVMLPKYTLSELLKRLERERSWRLS